MATAARTTNDLTAEAILANARAMTPAIAARSEEIEGLRRLPADLIAELRAASSEGLSVVSSSPFRRRHGEHQRQLAELVEPLDVALRNTRVVVRRVAVACYRREPVPASYASLMRDLADLSERVADELVADRMAVAVVDDLIALGLDPKSGGSLALPQPLLTAGNLTVSFTQPAGVSGITYKAEWSTTLESGNWTNISDTGTGNTHAFSIPAAANPRLFLRYVVTAP